jgi:hypothetical protein
VSSPCAGVHQIQSILVPSVISVFPASRGFRYVVVGRRNEADARTAAPTPPGRAALLGFFEVSFREWGRGDWSISGGSFSPGELTQVRPAVLRLPPRSIGSRSQPQGQPRSLYGGCRSPSISGPTRPSPSSYGSARRSGDQAAFLPPEHALIQP